MARGKKPLPHDTRALMKGPEILLCMSQEDFDRTLEEYNITQYGCDWLTEGALGNAYTFYHKDRLFAIVSLKPMRQPLAVMHALLVHEGTHIWQAYREYIGETTPSSEFEAYSMQAICEKLFKLYKEKRRKR